MRVVAIIGLVAGALGLAGCGDDDGTATPAEDSGMMSLPDTGPEPEIDAGSPDEVDAGGGDVDAGSGFSCEYPEGPYGARLLAKLEPFSLPQCDGTMYDFFNEEFCSNQLTLLNIAAGWCPPCIRESELLTEEITEPFRGRVRVIQVLVQDEDYRAATTDYCAGWVERFGLTNVELIDAAGTTQIYFPDGTLPSSVIIDGDGVIQYRANGISEEGIGFLAAKLRDLLGE